MANTDTPTSQALATVDQTPKAKIMEYQDSFKAVLPSHIAKPETWLRLAQGALKKGKRLRDGRTELEAAAQNNLPRFLSELLEAARLGLEPGTDEFYLTTRKVQGRAEIQGIVGYQGYIELMYRAGAVTSVVAECVYERDVFVWRPGALDVERMEQGKPPRWQGPQTQPYHEIDWDLDDRGALRLAYAYAVMKDGAISKVVVFNRAQIAKIRAKSPSAKSEHSPWNTNPDAMWLKTVSRQLRKWVPTSAEYRREMLRTSADAVGQRDVRELPVPDDSEDHIEEDDEEIVDAEIVENGNGHEYPPGEEPFE